MHFLHCCVAIYPFVAVRYPAYVSVRQKGPGRVERTEIMSKLLNAIHLKKLALGDADESVLAHAREHVWDKDRAAIAKAVKRIAMVRRKDEADGRDTLPAGARHAS